MSQDSPLPSQIVLMVSFDAEDIEWLIHQQIHIQQETGIKTRLPMIVQSLVKEARLAALRRTHMSHFDIWRKFLAGLHLWTLRKRPA